MVAIVDIDGVLACNKDRLVHVHTDRNNPDWEKFYEGLENDPVLPWARAIKPWHMAGFRIVLVTNRPERYRAQTVEWLSNNGVRYDELRMRSEGQRYENAKKHHLDELRKEYRIYIAIDDDPEHIKMYEAEGVTAVYAHSGYYDGGRVPDDKIVK